MTYEEEEKKQYMVIKIKKPHHAERLAWIILAAFLLSIIIYQWVIWPEEQLCPEPDVVELPVAKTETTPEPGPVAEVKPEVKKEEPKKEEPKPETKLSGRIEFAITDVSVEKKQGDFGKIMSISYSIDNQKKDFVPLVRFYLFDAQWAEKDYSAEMLARCCEQAPLLSLPLRAGAPKIQKILTPQGGSGFSVSNLNETKTIRLELYDKADTESLIAATEYSLKKSEW